MRFLPLSRNSRVKMYHCPRGIEGDKQVFAVDAKLTRVINGSSFTFRPYALSWFGLISELGSWVPNHNIWSATKRCSEPSDWSVHTVQQRASGISDTGWYVPRNGLTSQNSPVVSKRLQFAPAQQVSACVSILFLDMWPGWVFPLVLRDFARLI